MLSLLYTCLLSSSLLSLTRSSWALRNVTLDDTDPSITWVGEWKTVPPGFSSPIGGSYRTTTDPDAYAEFKFTGVAIHFASPRFPAVASTALILDNVEDAAVVVNLEDYETKTTDEEFGKSAILASAVMLEPSEHIVKVKMGASEGYGVFDAFIYTALEEGDAPGVATISLTGFTTIAPAPVVDEASTVSSTSTPSDPSPSESSSSNPPPSSNSPSSSPDSPPTSNSPPSSNSSPSSNTSSDPNVPPPAPNAAPPSDAPLPQGASNLPTNSRSGSNAPVASNSLLLSSGSSTSPTNALLPSASPEEDDSSSVSLRSSVMTAILSVGLTIGCAFLGS